MRRLLTTPQSLDRKIRRDSSISKVLSGNIASAYQGNGDRISVNLTNNGYGNVVARIPRRLMSKGSRPIGAPVSVVIRGGIPEVLSWSDRSPLFLLSTGTTQSVATASTTQLTLAAIDVYFDTVGIFDDANDRLTIPDDWAGVWHIDSTIYSAADNVGHRRFDLRLNGVEVAKSYWPTIDAVEWGMSISTKIPLIGGDDLTLHFRQTSGGNLNVTYKNLTAVWISP